MAKVQASKVCRLPNFFYNPPCTLGTGLMALGSSEKNKRGEATTHRCILRCLTQLVFEEWKSTHALNMLRSLEVIMTTHCTVFVLLRLLICLTKHALGLTLSLPGCVDHNQMSMAFRTTRTAAVSDAVFLLVKLGCTQKLV